MKLLDLFCGGGGASYGYHQAGLQVIGVDIEYHSDYPYPMLVADAMNSGIEFLYDDFDFIHASPPCQVYSKTKHTHSAEHPDLLEPTRKMLREWADRTGGTYVIENVPGAEMDDPLLLCGTHFGLATTDEEGQKLVLHRHRLFESNMWLLSPGRCKHKEYKNEGYRVAGVYGGGSTNPGRTARRGGYTPFLDMKRQIMGIDWMGQADIHQAIPPAYTRFIGKQLINNGSDTT